MNEWKLLERNRKNGCKKLRIKNHRIKMKKEWVKVKVKERKWKKYVIELTTNFSGRNYKTEK